MAVRTLVDDYLAGGGRVTRVATARARTIAHQVQHVGAVARNLRRAAHNKKRVLDLLQRHKQAGAKRGLTVADICAALGMADNPVRRLLAQLVRAGTLSVTRVRLRRQAFYEVR
jgi:lipoate synthase